jgi:hypothetical protein
MSGKLFASNFKSASIEEKQRICAPIRSHHCLFTFSARDELGSNLSFTIVASKLIFIVNRISLIVLQSIAKIKFISF